MSDKSKYQELLENILKTIVNHPDEVVVEKSLDERGVLLNIKLNGQDVPLVVGKKGRVINSIRSLVKTIALREKAFVNIRLEQPAGEAAGQSEEVDTSAVDNLKL